jgi:hypothetical protein
MGLSFSTCMTWCGRSLFRAALALSLIALSVGCSYGPPQQWTGQMVPVDVFDSDGEIYAAAALQIESGPVYQPPADVNIPEFEAPIGPELGGGKLPLLTEGDPYRIISRDRLPLGARVIVRGWMLRDFAYNPWGQREKGDFIVHRIPRVKGAPAVLEHMIKVDKISPLETK